MNQNNWDFIKDSFRVLESKGSFKQGLIVSYFEAFYFDLKVEAV